MIAVTAESISSVPPASGWGSASARSILPPGSGGSDVKAGERVVRNARLMIAATPGDRAEASGQVRSPGQTERASSQKTWQSRPRAAAQAHADSEVDCLLERV